MKQILLRYRNGEIALRDVPPPQLLKGGVLVATAASLISLGTEGQKVRQAGQSLLGKARERPDQVRQVLENVQKQGLAATVQKVRAKLEDPTPLGYSAAGTVIAVGAGVEDLAIGDRVACAGATACHAEVIFVPRNLCARAPDGVPFEAAACATVGAIAVHGVRQVAPRLGEWVAVIGLGLVGQFAVQTLRANGCRVVAVDPDPAKVRLAASQGAELAFVRADPNLEPAARRATDGRGWDAALITASAKDSDPIHLGARLMRDRGRVVVLGAVKMDLARGVFYDKEIELRMARSYGPGRYDPQFEEHGHDYPAGYVRWTETRNMDAFLALVASGQIRVDPIITHRYSFAEAERAYALLNGNGAGPPPMGIIFQYDTTQPQPTSVAPTVPRPRGPAAAPGIGLIGAGSFAKQVLLPALQRAEGVRLIGVTAASGSPAVTSPNGSASPTAPATIAPCSTIRARRW
ncbi:MAG: zinc-binding alcohol dehydrogenase [Dehalococcoidia bacterium]